MKTLTEAEYRQHQAWLGDGIRPGTGVRGASTGRTGLRGAWKRSGPVMCVGAGAVKASTARTALWAPWVRAGGDIGAGAVERCLDRPNGAQRLLNASRRLHAHRLRRGGGLDRADAACTPSTATARGAFGFGSRSPDRLYRLRGGERLFGLRLCGGQRPQPGDWPAGDVFDECPRRDVVAPALGRVW